MVVLKQSQPYREVQTSTFLVVCYLFTCFWGRVEQKNMLHTQDDVKMKGQAKKPLKPSVSYIHANSNAEVSKSSVYSNLKVRLRVDEMPNCTRRATFVKHTQVRVDTYVLLLKSPHILIHRASSVSATSAQHNRRYTLAKAGAHTHARTNSQPVARIPVSEPLLTNKKTFSLAFSDLLSSNQQRRRRGCWCWRRTAGSSDAPLMDCLLGQFFSHWEAMMARGKLSVRVGHCCRC